MRKNKREIPDLFTQKNERPIGSSMFAFGCGGTLVSYIPKKNKNVLLFSTMHKGDDINGVTGKPEIIHRNNETKGGVDVVDKLCAQYNVARGTRRWPMVIFYSMVNVAVINSFIIYNSKNLNSTSPRREFLIKLSSSLLYLHQKNRAMITNLPKTIKQRLREIYTCGTSPSQEALGAYVHLAVYEKSHSAFNN
ncbi:hypothetical protein NQ318_018198 [Aromia moschata]|uniref:PiggyBac transposable element-derived protein domain-containing protein n=1 Tax=Aromia moschata TaxID=1265417 RepID=A0AAV8ZE85_9CUCU|nr:hypothetical protein NQ318_018198 [Aromia moschata]